MCIKQECLPVRVLLRHTILGIAVLLLIGCGAVRGQQQIISREEAIGIALQIARAPQPELSPALTEPTNVQAERMRLIDALRLLDETIGPGGDPYDKETVVWLVTMEGTWMSAFPRPRQPPDAPEPEQEPYRHYAIILDATSGTTIMASARP